MAESPDRRSPLAIAAEWSSQITAISIEMVLPGLLGYWLDRRWGWLPWLTVLGMFLGMALGTWQLVRLVQARQTSDRRGR